MPKIEQWPPDHSKAEIANENTYNVERKETLATAKKVLLELVSELHNAGTDLTTRDIVLYASRYRQIVGGNEEVFAPSPEVEITDLFDVTIKNILDKTNNPYLKIDMEKFLEYCEELHQIHEEL